MAPTTQTTSALAHLSQSSGDVNGYEALLNKVVCLPNDQVADDLIAYIDGLFNSPLGLVYVRPLLDSFANTISTISGPGSNEVKITVGEHAIDLLQAQTSSFEEQNGKIREIMATAYEAEEDWSAAAKILSGINTNSTTRKFSNEELVGLYIRIARTLLEDDDTTGAEAWLNKAKNHIYLVTDKELNLHFNLSQARVMDAKRNFINAAQGYLQISYDTSIAEEERSKCLSMAIKCAILAPAGPARARMLGRLYKDERSVSLDEHAILEKMFYVRLISPQESTTFAAGLQPHQLAKTADGNTVVAKAIIQHNIVATSKLYANITFGDLGTLLGMSGDAAEATVARMIEQGRLTARIDQVQSLISFEDAEATGETSKKSDGALNKELRKYDANIQGLAETVEKVTSALQAEYPDFVAQQLLVA